MKISTIKREALLKRLADYLEKVSVGSFVAGVFQHSLVGVCLCIITVMLSFLITLLLEE